MQRAVAKMAAAAGDDGYAAALEALGSLISGRARADGASWDAAFAAMTTYCERLELGGALERLSVVHVAGTKGKGSTCAFAESVLRHTGRKTGLFTSPHLVDVRERIRIDGRPVSRELFVEHFWWCFRRLEETATADVPMPAYFRFLTLLALRIFDVAQVDVVVLEVGLGGRLDATNVVPAPAVCGVTSLGYDHVQLLGHTLREIAREKAGIFKPGVPAFTAPQPEEAMASLETRAGQVGIPLEVARPLESYGESVKIGLAGAHQRLNAALAVQLCRTWAARAPSPPPNAAADEAELAAGRLPAAYATGLAATTWPGRAQVLHLGVDPGEDAVEGGAASSPPEAAAERGLTLFLDGAHTPESTEQCGEWFSDAVSALPDLPTQRMLLFNCKDERDPQKLLQPLVGVLQARGVHLHNALFVAPESTGAAIAPTADNADTAWPRSLRKTWDDMQREPAAASAAPQALPPFPAGTDVAQPSGSAVLPSLAAALEWIRRCAREQQPPGRVHVLVTGSLYLVGDVLRLLRRAP